MIQESEVFVSTSLSNFDFDVLLIKLNPGGCPIWGSSVIGIDPCDGLIKALLRLLVYIRPLTNSHIYKFTYYLIESQNTPPTQVGRRYNPYPTTIKKVFYNILIY